MGSMRYCVISCLLVSSFAVPAICQEVVVIKADRIDTVTSGVIENGTIVIKDGRIKAIGNDVKVPESAEILDMADKTIFPGLVNPASRIGLSPPPTGKPTSTPQYRVVDELYPHQDAYKRILRAGFTTIGLLPSDRANVRYYSGYGYFFGSNMPSPGIAGQGAVVRPKGQRPKDMIVTESSLMMINFQANDKTKKVIKNALESAKSKTDSKDPEVLPLVRAIQGEIPTFLTCNTPGEVLHLIELIEPYDKMELVLIAGSETYRLVNKLAEKKISVIHPAQIDFESNTRNPINVPRMLSDAGIKIALKPKTDSVAGYEDMLRKIAELVKYGLDREIAKKAITISPAKMLAVDYRLGSLEIGKDANLLILSGDPLDIGTRLHHVMIEGKIVYEAP
jgi:hypothetical protein